MDYLVYDAVDSFTFEHAAKLCCEIEKLDDGNKLRCSAIFQQLIRDAESGHLPYEKALKRAARVTTNYVTGNVRHHPESIDWLNCRAKRVDLMRWARARNMHAPFLFPEQRPGYWGDSGSGNDRMRTFTLAQAADALANNDEDGARRWRDALVQSAKTGELRVSPTYRTWEEYWGQGVIFPLQAALHDIRETWHVTREDLKQWCLPAPNLRPPFLFPSGTQGTPGKDSVIRPAAPKAKPLHTKERATALKLIIGMATCGYKYNSQATRNGATAEIAKDLDSLQLSLDEDTVRKWLKDAAEYLPKISNNS